MSIKLDLPLIAAVLACLLLLEMSHRTALEVQSSVAAKPERAACADYDTRYAVNRLMFFTGGFVSSINRRQIMADRATLPPGCAP